MKYHIFNVQLVDDIQRKNLQVHIYSNNLEITRKQMKELYHQEGIRIFFSYNTLIEENHEE